MNQNEYAYEQWRQQSFKSALYRFLNTNNFVFNVNKVGGSCESEIPDQKGIELFYSDGTTELVELEVQNGLLTTSSIVNALNSDKLNNGIYLIGIQGDNSVTAIEQYCFYSEEFEKIKFVRFPNVTSIGTQAFVKRTKLE